MKLDELLAYNPIMVQCHDNPDADAIASGYALYTYFKEMGKDVKFVYSGRSPVSKANLVLLIEYLGIGELLQFVPNSDAALALWDISPEAGAVEGSAGTDSADKGNSDEAVRVFPGLLVTADCQYGAGNVTKIPAKNVAIIDHHQREILDVEMSEIASDFGSCSTLVWKMFKDVQFHMYDTKLSTALYFGLYTDTNAMSEVFNPYDKDMRDFINYDKSVINVFRNSNFSLAEFEIAGHAMNRYIFDETHRFAFIRAEQCDPNILGMISDFLLQVAEVNVCIVYNSWPTGYKFSARSCVKEVHADDLAAFLTEGIGSGGGHLEKAGGFIQRKAYEEKYGKLPSEEFLRRRLVEYFESALVVHAGEYKVDLSVMKEYVKRPMPRGYVLVREILPVGTPIMIRTIEGDAELTVEDSTVVQIGIKGEVYPTKYEKFARSYELTEESYETYLQEGKLPFMMEYVPTLHNRLDGTVIDLLPHAKVCMAGGGTHIYAMQSDKRLKVFTQWNGDNYYAGKVGDYLAARADDLDDVYIVEKDIFALSYEEVVKDTP